MFRSEKGGVRAWIIVTLLTVSTVLNYLDRQTLSILAPFLQEDLHISVAQYAHIVAGFLLAYGIMYAVSGWFVDLIGERIGMAFCIAWWSLCTMATGLARGALSLGMSRLLLGIGEPGNYPAALKATTKWFPEEKRGVPIALFSCGSSIGSILAPPLIAYIALRFGWRLVFLFPGSLGLLWLLFWLGIYRRPSEETEMDGRTQRKSVQWGTLFRNSNVLALIGARFISDPASYFAAFWIPEYLKRARHFTMADIGRYGWIPFLAGAAGGVIGGRIADELIHRGTSAVKARLLILLGSSVLAPAAIFTDIVPSSADAIILLSILNFVVFCWFINTAAIIPDIASHDLTGSILGMIGSAGSLSGFVFMLIAGSLLSRTLSFNTVFLIVGSLHVCAAIVLWFVMWRAEAGISKVNREEA